MKGQSLKLGTFRGQKSFLDTYVLQKRLRFCGAFLSKDVHRDVLILSGASNKEIIFRFWKGSAMHIETLKWDLHVYWQFDIENWTEDLSVAYNNMASSLQSSSKMNTVYIEIYR